METQNVSDKFKLWKKWFWIGMIIAFFNLLAGLIFGIALVPEKEHRKEGAIIIAFALLWFVLGTFVIFPLIVKAGHLPQYKIMMNTTSGTK